jgi:hypothetical protein
MGNVRAGYTERLVEISSSSLGSLYIQPPQLNHLHIFFIGLVSVGAKLSNDRDHIVSEPVFSYLFQCHVDPQRRCYQSDLGHWFGRNGTNHSSGECLTKKL